MAMKQPLDVKTKDLFQGYKPSMCSILSLWINTITVLFVLISYYVPYSFFTLMLPLFKMKENYLKKYSKEKTRPVHKFCIGLFSLYSTFRQGGSVTSLTDSY